MRAQPLQKGKINLPLRHFAFSFFSFKSSRNPTTRSRVREARTTSNSGASRIATPEHHRKRASPYHFYGRFLSAFLLATNISDIFSLVLRIFAKPSHAGKDGSPVSFSPLSLPPSLPSLSPPSLPTALPAPYYFSLSRVA